MTGKTQKRSKGKHQLPPLPPIIQTLRKYFNDAPARSIRCDVWDFLSALRGPDENKYYAYKLATTGVIRAALLGKGKGTQWWRFGSQVALEDTAEFCRLRKKLSRLPKRGHFYYHACLAFKAIGLKWDRVNVLN